VLLFLPLWPDFVGAQFLLFPARTAVIRATVPAMVMGISVREGELTTPGTPLVSMRNLDIESRSAEAQEKLREASAQETKAVLRYTDIAAAQQERQRQATDEQLAGARVAQLSIASPISGVVTTAHVEDLVGRSVDEGDLLMQVEDTSELKAQVYIPEFAMHDVQAGQSVKLLVQGQFRPISGMLSSLSATSATLPEGLLAREQLQGINLPRYFVATVWIRNVAQSQPGARSLLLPGATGTAKVLVARRSVAGFCWRFGRDLVERKVW
jgi:multidrug resistance efflux pump